MSGPSAPQMLAGLSQRSPQAASQVAVYRGDGAGQRSVRSAVDSLQGLLPPSFQVGMLPAKSGMR